MAELSRARTIEDLFNRLSRMRTPQGGEYGRRFRPRPTDIIIDTYAKAGTTWMQQIVHGLRSRGDMNFAEITEVVPWIELAGDLELDLDGEQTGQFRAFKSHSTWQEVGKGCRYICIIRDPKDIVISQYNFLNGWFLEPGSVSLETFVREFFLADFHRRGYLPHLLSWWPQREHQDVLFLCYENMRTDLVATVETVAEFAGISDRQAIDIAIRQSSFEFMSQHKNQFDDNLITRLRNRACGLPEDAISSKVKAGKVGDHKELLSEESHRLMDGAWKETVGKTLGYSDYGQLRAALGP
jgi:Sulfotransferase domain